LGQVIRGPRMLMITATTITATTITVMRPHQFVITVTMRIPRTHAPPMDTGDQISSLTVYSSAPARGSPVGMDEDITAAVVMGRPRAVIMGVADTAADTAVDTVEREAIVVAHEVLAAEREVVVAALAVAAATVVDTAKQSAKVVD